MAAGDIPGREVPPPASLPGCSNPKQDFSVFQQLFFFFFFAAQGPVVLGQGDGSHPGALPGSEDGADSAAGSGFVAPGFGESFN